jgi:NADH:ubiquinone oxidoreductase subunit 5 (subunit L)/multisubunit Na+/H+ antiporter MnhA subunit
MLDYWCKNRIFSATSHTSCDCLPEAHIVLVLFNNYCSLFYCARLTFCFEADLFHPERGGTVKRGHIHDQGATAKLQIGVRSGAQLGAEAVAQEKAEAVAQFMMNILKK